jgi:hypothetical protein
MCSTYVVVYGEGAIPGERRLSEILDWNATAVAKLNEIYIKL